MFPDLAVAALPGTAVTFDLDIELGSFPSFPSLALKQQPALRGNVSVDVGQCPVGFTLSGSTQCVACPTGEFSWDPSADRCSSCPAGATCPGGAEMLVLPGFWRRDNRTAQLYECPLPAHCRPEGCTTGYGNAPLLHGALRLTCVSVWLCVAVCGCMWLCVWPCVWPCVWWSWVCGCGCVWLCVWPCVAVPVCMYVRLLCMCASYRGALCASCAPGYGKSGDDCRECPHFLVNALILLAVLVAGVSVALWMINRAQRRAKTRNIDVVRYARVESADGDS